jgi:hypothetical protein
MTSGVDGRLASGLCPGCGSPIAEDGFFDLARRTTRRASEVWIAPIATTSFRSNETLTRHCSH